MDNIDKLIKELQEAKEELNKADGLDDRWSKRKDMGDGRVVTGKDPSPKQEDKEMRAVAEKHDKSDGTKSGPSPSPESVESQMQGQIKKGDYFCLFKNGQWSLDKSIDPSDASARHHTKKFNKLNSHYPKPTNQPNDALAADFRESEAHHAKTGQAIKFPKATQMGKEEDVEKADEPKASPKASPKGLPYAGTNKKS